jgi:putative flavoprotein involved in K+ transport
VTGRDGGRDIDLRRFALEGMRLHGRLTDVRGGVLRLAADLAQNLDQADAASEKIKRGIDAFIGERGIDAPPEEPYRPCWEPDRPERELDLAAAGVSAVVWSTGFRSDYGWIEVPVFDGKGYPTHDRGVTSVDGLFFLGLSWLHTWGSGRFSGVGRDARYLADRIARRLAA